jgi:predicted RNA-binding Zn ribbon-like protein
MPSEYPGPLRREPLAIELHNTLYASRGRVIDGLAEAEGPKAWLTAIGKRLPAGGTGGGDPSLEELVELRAAVREALHAVIEGRPPPRAAIETLNRASARAPRSAAARWRRTAAPVWEPRVHTDRRADVVVAAFAADAIELITGPRRDAIRACGAPGCVLLFLKDHPRREWCSNACGNRARQARHYERTRGRGSRSR